MTQEMKMYEQDGTTYGLEAFERGALVVDEAKTGKSCFLVSSLLGLLPWQKNGGVIDRPSHLHVIATDTNALGGVMEFLTKTCSAPSEALKFKIYNLEKAVLQSADNAEGNDTTFYNLLISTIMTIRERAASQPGVHAMVMSSLTVMASTMQRGLSGSPLAKGKGMDADKWGRFKGMMSDLRTFSQAGDLHTFWEAHLQQRVEFGDPGGQAKDSLLISGSAGKDFPSQVEHIFRVRRLHGQKYENTQCDHAFLDVTASSDFVPGGRLFTERLGTKEKCLTVAMHKLGKKIGGWKAKIK